MKEFRLYGEVLQFTDQECAFRNVDIIYRQHAEKALEEVTKYYDSIRKGSNFLEQFMKDQKIHWNGPVRRDTEGLVAYCSYTYCWRCHDGGKREEGGSG